MSGSLSISAPHPAVFGRNNHTVQTAHDLIGGKQKPTHDHYRGDGMRGDSQNQINHLTIMEDPATFPHAFIGTQRDGATPKRIRQ